MQSALSVLHPHQLRQGEAIDPEIEPTGTSIPAFAPKFRSYVSDIEESR